MSELTLAQALNGALATALETDERVVLLGEDIGRTGGSADAGPPAVQVESVRGPPGRREAGPDDRRVSATPGGGKGSGSGMEPTCRCPGCRWPR